MTRFVLMGAAGSLAVLSMGSGAAAEEAASQRLAPIQIFGDRSAVDPGSVSVVQVETIADLSADHPAEILNTLPGVNIQMNSGQEHLIALRSPVLNAGAGQGSFLILENGVPTRAPAFGNVNSLLEPHHEIASAIEVVRGPGSAKYGSNAVHGLINVILPVPDRPESLDARASISTLGRYKADIAFDTGNGQAGGLSVQKDTGWRDNTDVTQLKFSGKATFEAQGWDGLAWIAASNLEQETAGFIEGARAYRDRDLARSNPNPEAFRDAWSVRAGARLERDMGPGLLTVTPFARLQQMQFRQHFLPYRGLERNGHGGGGVMARYDIEVSDTLNWRVGGDVDLSRGFLRETQPEPFGFFPGDARFPVGIHYDYSVDTAMGAVWGELDWQVSDRLSVLGGLRAETHDYDYSTDAPVGINGRFNVPANRSDSFSFVTPKLGALYEVNDTVSLYANYARGARAPQASDLYRLQSLQGVAEADVETLDSVELGGRGSVADIGLTFDVAAYWMEKENFFFRDSNRLNVSDGSSRHQGVEALFAWQPMPTFEISGTASWSDQIYTFDRIVGSASETITDGNEIDTAPEWIGDASFKWLPNEVFEASVSLEYIGEYFTNPANTQRYPGHTLTHARVSYGFQGGIETYLIVRNLFDRAYADRADFAFGDERYFPGEPLNATFGIRKTF